MNGINWETVADNLFDRGTIFNLVEYLELNASEAVEVAKNGGDIYDLDNMLHLRELLGFSVSYNLYHYIDNHYDGGILELEKEDFPALVWLVEDYVKNGWRIEKQDIWKDYDFDSEKDQYGFVGWHKRVKEGTR